MWKYIALPNTAMTNIQHDKRCKALIQHLTVLGFLSVPQRVSEWKYIPNGYKSMWKLASIHYVDLTPASINLTIYAQQASMLCIKDCLPYYFYRFTRA